MNAEDTASAREIIDKYKKLADKWYNGKKKKETDLPVDGTHRHVEKPREIAPTHPEDPSVWWAW